MMAFSFTSSDIHLSAGVGHLLIIAARSFKSHRTLFLKFRLALDQLAAIKRPLGSFGDVRGACVGVRKEPRTRTLNHAA
jgi:hypothetical protein